MVGFFSHFWELKYQLDESSMDYFTLNIPVLHLNLIPCYHL